MAPPLNLSPAYFFISIAISNRFISNRMRRQHPSAKKADSGPRPEPGIAWALLGLGLFFGGKFLRRRLGDFSTPLLSRADAFVHNLGQGGENFPACRTRIEGVDGAKVVDRVILVVYRNYHFYKFPDVHLRVNLVPKFRRRLRHVRRSRLVSICDFIWSTSFSIPVGICSIVSISARFSTLTSALAERAKAKVIIRIRSFAVFHRENGAAPAEIARLSARPESLGRSRAKAMLSWLNQSDSPIPAPVPSRPAWRPPRSEETCSSWPGRPGSDSAGAANRWIEAGRNRWSL